MKKGREFIVVGALLGFFPGFFSWQCIKEWWADRYKPYVLEEFVSPDSAHSIKIVADDEPFWGFGGQSVHVEADDFFATRSTEEINTDGGEFEEYSVAWNGSTAEVMLNLRYYNSDQECKVYEFNFEDGRITARTKTNAELN